MPRRTNWVPAEGFGNGVRFRPNAIAPLMPQIAEAVRKATPQRERGRCFGSPPKARPRAATASMSVNWPTTHNPPRWIKPSLISAGNHLHYGAAAAAAVALHHVTFNPACDHQFNSGLLLTEALRSHERFGNFWPACAKRQWRRGAADSFMLLVHSGKATRYRCRLERQNDCGEGPTQALPVIDQPSPRMQRNPPSEPLSQKQNPLSPYLSAIRINS